MHERFQNPSPDAIRTLLQRVKTIAVVGLSPRRFRASHGVAKALQEFGYKIIPVNPNVDEVLGEKAYPALREVPAKIDLVDVFRNARHVDELVDECIELGLPALWLQDEVIDEAAALKAKAAGLFVVMDRCIYRDYSQLL